MPIRRAISATDRGWESTPPMTCPAGCCEPAALGHRLDGLAWAGTLDAGTALAIQHAVMVPAMLAVMLWRYDEYAQAHASIPARRPPTSE